MGYRIILTLLAGVAYWYAVRRVDGVGEPWDADGYWVLWYPVSLVLSGVAGFFLRRRGWLAGLPVTLAQLPVLWIDGAGTGNLRVAGLLMILLLAIPAMAVSAISGCFAARPHRAG